MNFNDFKEVPPMFSYLTNLIGYENTRKLFTEFGGTSIYFPSLENINKDIRNKDIINQFQKNNLTFRELSKKFNLSENQIRNIIRNSKTF